ncbi:MULTISPECIES: sulfurtransferase complex subunit TusD [Halomonadaceae]|jgi:tRNA 2-thiouridine synthesizing protein D|uniref:Sulfurtransferase complex subunit TusD n=1 Tax=Vreelandella piezotolerans TaxID=2609667 RepID=A0ABQ6X8E0_9GAMM|nr:MULTISPECIES: sulfurtransferase complex subunit TusD [Halomonas]KAE8438293.1 sulfurtransferase complex subunit TusD [Halomonas piezotolerans]MCG7575244.1 sulfurtransferase complex subunit TusD [Halomonas sp. MMH1-48]MCG7591745.1 sulfurtransferase complex subunit TusD [Halomonas sp. McD50-5]MCG7602306.1 sulfurtransferase complex subunit TusD [Halomonas sp. MM17-34]MCG7611936.1 sulfurtransferase complex subunit TusD [Halomonas sp. MM17-29]|tara:strand:+ start:538 stop:927 length:390 start_codon:yes stop_codon:yes gene_type:complete
MEYGLLVMGAPYASAAPHSALRFAKALIDTGHRVAGIFFYQEGVHNASQLMTPPQDELNMRDAWIALHHEHGVALEVCIAAALRRGIMSETEAKRHGQTHFNLQAPFELTGLGQLLALQQRCDRVITFA